MINLKFCYLETDDNFVFCIHGSPEAKIDTIALVFTDNKEDEGEQKQIDVCFCPFCGYSFNSQQQNLAEG